MSVKRLMLSVLLLAVPAHVAAQEQRQLGLAPIPQDETYVLDGLGGIHPGGDALAVSPATPYFGFDIARDLELAPTGIYVLDGFGGVHAGGGAPPVSPSTPYFGFDVAMDLEVASTGIYVLDAFGGVHAGGGAPPFASTLYFGFDIARDLELAGAGGYVLDGYGGVHAGGGAAQISPRTPYFGFDVAVDLEMVSTGAYVLDGFGGVHSGGGIPPVNPATPYFGAHAARGLELGGSGVYVLDYFGGVHPGGGASSVSPATPYFGFDIARDLEVRLASLVIGGTFRDFYAGIIGTAFLFDPALASPTFSTGQIQGPPGWNGGNPGDFHPYQPLNTAASRSPWWFVTVPPVGGRYFVSATGGIVNAPVDIDVGSSLTPPEITSFTVSPGVVSVDWTAISEAQSFLVRVSPFPWVGAITGEKVVSGATRAATLTALAMTPGASYQISVFAFNHDLITPSGFVSPFNIGAQGLLFVGQ